MAKKTKKKIVFISGTRADFGKIKSILTILGNHKDFEIFVFATGMHLSKKHGFTVKEIEKCKFGHIERYVNGAHRKELDEVLANTISGFGKYVKKIRPDLIVVHGDRGEAMAGALVGSMNNVPVAHIEGGEVSGTVDEHIRHAISKLSQLHFVANQEAKKRLIQMGEKEKNIFVIGSPDLDIMVSKKLPSLSAVKKYYEIPFDSYGIVIFHPVTTELTSLAKQAAALTDALITSDFNYVVIFPNSDNGSEIIFDAYRKKILPNKKFKVFPSLRFEYFLTLLKNARCIVGNSSAGIREAPFYGIPSINIGTRQNGRAVGSAESIVNVPAEKKQIATTLRRFMEKEIRYPSDAQFGDGRSAERFLGILERHDFWKIEIQKRFLDFKLDEI